MKKAVLTLAAVALTGLGFVSCGGYSSSAYKPPSGLLERVVVSQDISSPSAAPGLLIINANNDTLPLNSEISAGNRPTLLALSQTRSTLLAFSNFASTNTVTVINTVTEQTTGSIVLPGATTSMVLPATSSFAYAAVPSVPVPGSPPGAIEVMSLTQGVATTVGVPGAQTVISNSSGTVLVVFSNDYKVYVVLPPVIQSLGVVPDCSVQPNPACIPVQGFDRPVGGIFSADGSTVYVLNAGPEQGGTVPSVQILDTTAFTAGASVAVNGATVGFLQGSTLYVAGTPAGTACPAGTAATSCGTLDIVDVDQLTDTNFANPILITDGSHTLMDMSVNGQLFIGASTCTNIGNVNNPVGEVRGCLSVFDTTKPGNTTAVIPPDNFDVTGLQSFSTRTVEYVVEGGALRIYDTTTDALQTTQIPIVGQLVDVKAINFF